MRKIIAALASALPPIMSNTLQYLIFTILLFCISYGNSQEKNYLVLNSNDTLFGKTRLPISFGKEVFYFDVFIILEGDSIEKKFEAKEIKSYTNSGNLYIGNGYQVMKRIVDGKIKLYDCYVERNSTDIRTYVETNIAESSGKGLYRGFCININSKLPYSIEKLDFKRNGFELFKENTDLNEATFYYKYRYRDIPALVKAYNSKFK